MLTADWLLPVQQFRSVTVVKFMGKSSSSFSIAGKLFVMSLDSVRRG